MSKCISVIVSVFNEEKALKQFYATTNKILDDLVESRSKGGAEAPGYQLLFVNDGSADKSREILEEFQRQDP